MNKGGGKEIIAFSIPTGIGAEIGGFAGDAGYVVREFSKYFEVIVNPNVVNAGALSAINDDMLYVEGYAFDALLSGELQLKRRNKSVVLECCPAQPSQQSLRQTGLRPWADSAKNKIGVIFDKSIPQNILNMHINTINAAKVVWGLDILGYEITDEPAGVEFNIKNGISSGALGNPKTLLAAGQKLIQKGAQALAVVCLFDEHDDSLYSQGKGTDPIGGVEAVISHYLTKELMVPIAHSPAFSELDISNEIVCEKASAEYISSTYLPCILQGLAQAPMLVRPRPASLLPSAPSAAVGELAQRSRRETSHTLLGTQMGTSEWRCPNNQTQELCNDYLDIVDEISHKDIKTLVVPSGALGSKGVLGCIKNNIQVCAVKNPCAIEITCQKLGLGDIIEFDNYKTCLDFLRNKL